MKGKGKMRSSSEFYVILEILQVSFILYVSASLVAYTLSTIFTEFDNYLEDSKISKGLFDVIKVFEVFIQLFLSTIAYYYIEKMLLIIPSISKFLKSSYTSHKTAKYALHMVMIITLIESNKSLKHGFEYISDMYAPKGSSAIKELI